MGTIIKNKGAFLALILGVAVQSQAMTGFRNVLSSYVPKRYELSVLKDQFTRMADPLLRKAKEHPYWLIAGGLAVSGLILKKYLTSPAGDSAPVQGEPVGDNTEQQTKLPITRKAKKHTGRFAKQQKLNERLKGEPEKSQEVQGHETSQTPAQVKMLNPQAQAVASLAFAAQAKVRARQQKNA